MNDKKQTINELQERVDHLESTVSALMNFISLEEDRFSITTKGEISFEALNINASATEGVTLSGGASAEISSGGNTTVKGALVMIN